LYGFLNYTNGINVVRRSSTDTQTSIDAGTAVLENLRFHPHLFTTINFFPCRTVFLN
ncbi:hypothetical protein L9F63_004323, partial [Diploptera punctata]